jgi:predicted transposase/invertase (TIGR01784 family)
MNINMQKQIATHHITFDEARKTISEMNLINNFLFDSSMENEEDAKIVAGKILKTIFNREFKDIKVFSQKQFNAVDTPYHSIRLDVYITENTEDKTYNATIYNIEMEDRLADKNSLPHRNRYYAALHDSKLLASGVAYDNLPDFVSITISSYDPFDSGDMCYVAKTILESHPRTEYNDGLTHLYFYCKGRSNPEIIVPIIQSPLHGKKLQEMLHYIQTGEKPAVHNQDIDDIDKVVTKVKKREEVTTKYMRQWEREQSLVKETKKEAALEIIRNGREDGISDEKTRIRIRRIGLDDSTIDTLFAQVNSEEADLAGTNI